MSSVILLFFFLVLIVASLIFLNAGEKIVLENSEDQKEPEEVDGLQTGEQCECDVLTNPALVLLGFPVQFEGSNGPELSQNGPQDFQVDEVSKVDPDCDESAEVGSGDDGVEVVECLGGLQEYRQHWSKICEGGPYRKEEVRNVVGNIDRNTDIGEVESITQSDKGHGDNVMTNKLLEILPWLLQLQHQHDRLLSPIACLKEVVGLEQSLMFTMRETHKHGRRVEIPDIRSTHDIQPERTKDPKVDRRVDLFHKPRGLSPATNSTVDSPRPNKTLHNEFSGERQHNSVESHKRNILLAFSIHNWATGVLRRLRVG